MAPTAASTSQAALASTLIAPAGPRPSRTAASRSASSARDDRGSATLTFAVRPPEARTSRCASAGGTTGTVQLTGTRSRSGPGHPEVAASTALSSHGTHSSSPYSRKGENSPQPAGPRSRTPSRTVMSRNRVRIGMA